MCASRILTTSSGGLVTRSASVMPPGSRGQQASCRPGHEVNKQPESDRRGQTTALSDPPGGTGVVRVSVGDVGTVGCDRLGFGVVLRA